LKGFVAKLKIILKKTKIYFKKKVIFSFERYLTHQNYIKFIKIKYFLKKSCKI